MWIILLLLGLGFLGVHVANVIKTIDDLGKAGITLDALQIANIAVNNPPSPIPSSPLLMYAILAFAGVVIALGLEKVARRLKDKT